jgi:DNA repair protein RadC
MNTSYTTVAEVKLIYETKPESRKKIKIKSSKAAYDLMQHLWDKSQIEYRETVKIILLNRANYLLGVNTIAEGGISEAVVDVRMILQAALLSNASAIMLVHNHPSGDTKPSNGDDLMTCKAKKAVEALDILLLDHLIITQYGYYSYADNHRI